MVNQSLILHVNNVFVRHLDNLLVVECTVLLAAKPINNNFYTLTNI